MIYKKSLSLKKIRKMEIVEKNNLGNSPYNLIFENLTNKKIENVNLINYNHEKQNEIYYSCLATNDYNLFLRCVGSNSLINKKVALIRFIISADFKGIETEKIIFDQINSNLSINYLQPNGVGNFTFKKIRDFFNEKQIISFVIDMDFKENEIILKNDLQLILEYLMPKTKIQVLIYTKV